MTRKKDKPYAENGGTNVRGIVCYDGILFERHPGAGFYSKLHQTKM